MTTGPGRGRLGTARIVAIIRLRDGTRLVRIATELADAGLRAVEITLPTPLALDAVTALRPIIGEHCAVGVGTIRRPSDVQAAFDAGAQFLVTPTMNAGVLAEALRLEIPVICGALTPSEIDNAWSAGAAIVKVFPASLGGPSYISEVRAPLDDIPLLPTGGVTAEMVGPYAAAGAVGVGVGSALVAASVVAAEDWAALRLRAARFTRAATEAWPDCGPSPLEATETAP